MLLLTLAAVIPAIYLIRYVYLKDHLEKESPKLIRGLILMGVLSTFAASLTESAGSFILGFNAEQGSTGSVITDFLMYFFVVGLSEEGFKYLLLKKKTWNNPEFNCLFDGVVYATAVSLGFALWENVLYVWQLGFMAALIRAVTAVPGHACFGVFMGAYYGAAKRLELWGNPAESKKYRQRALLIPVLLHGLYDFIATGESWVATIMFVVFIIFLFKTAIGMVKRISANDAYFNQQ